MSSKMTRPRFYYKKHEARKMIVKNSEFVIMNIETYK